MFSVADIFLLLLMLQPVTTDTCIRSIFILWMFLLAPSFGVRTPLNYDKIHLKGCAIINETNKQKESSMTQIDFPDPSIIVHY